MANVKYTDLAGLQYALSKFLEKSDLRFLGINDVAKLLYTNVNLTDVSDVNGALNSLVTLYLAVDELANQNKEDIDTINNAENGILEQAKSYTNEIVAAQTHLSFKIISSLPTTDISTSTIYLLPVNGDADNVYEEYIYIDNKWESIGTTQTDLTNYYTKTEIDEKINTINENINKKVDKVDGMGLSQENYTTEEKTKLSEIQTITTSEIDTAINNAFNK